MDNIEKMLEKLLGKFDSLETKFNSLESRFDTLEAKVDNIEQDVKTIKKDMATKKQVDILANQLAHFSQDTNNRLGQLEQEAVVDVNVVKFAGGNK